jgi:hypothetical protein
VRKGRFCPKKTHGKRRKYKKIRVLWDMTLTGATDFSEKLFASILRVEEEEVFFSKI